MKPNKNKDEHLTPWNGCGAVSGGQVAHHFAVPEDGASPGTVCECGQTEIYAVSGSSVRMIRRRGTTDATLRFNADPDATYDFGEN